jgi:integrase
MASIKKYDLKDGSHAYRVRYRDPDHKQREKSFRKKRDADNFKSRVEVEIADDNYFDRNRSKVSVSSVAAEWFSGLVDIKPSTRGNYEGTLRKHVEPTWGTLNLNQLKHAAIQEWVAKLSETLKPSTVQQILLVLQMICDHAILTGRLRVNPCSNVRKPKKDNSQPKKFLTFAQVKTLSSSCGDDADIVLILALTGIRWGELAGLTGRDIDTSSRRLDINSTLSETHGKLELGSPKNNTRRSVPYPAMLDDAFRLRCAGKDPGDFVFQSPKGGRLRNSNFRNRVFKPALRDVREHDSSFPELTIHDLRHTAASLAVSAGANVKSLQRMLGHKTAALTLDTYAELFEDDLDSVAVALNHMAMD